MSEFTSSKDIVKYRDLKLIPGSLDVSGVTVKDLILTCELQVILDKHFESNPFLKIIDF